MIKNWTVKTRQIKKSANGFINYINYLKSHTASSHADTHIVVLDDNAKNILAAVDERKHYRKLNRLKGGSVSNYATSFVMSLPKDIKQPTVKEWHKIGRFAVKQLSKTLNIPYEKLLKHSHIVLHKENGSKNSHLNLVVSNVIDLKVEKKITQFAATHTVKKSFNMSVKKLLNEDNYKYVPKQNNVGDKPLWLAREEAAETLKQQVKLYNRGLKKLKSLLATLKLNFINWSTVYIDEIESKANKNAINTARTVNEIEKISESSANEVNRLIEKIESLRPDAPEEARVSTKRKRRRRRQNKS
ncbi:MAG TPA: hypothetical protein DG048_20340 [Pseudoalteromonas sp.]|nr:hypothetical protein [Pseudoalteromonas sp.]|tara:strand:+ start:3672 stop:4574 length:903 start_codon:yes stop_codon:yes gene_type:complete